MNKYDSKNNQRAQNRSKSNRREVFYINYNIKSSYVSVVSEDKTTKVMKLNDAIDSASSKGLDLVQIAYDKASHRAVCKILDYGKFKYEQSKKEKNAKKQARANLVEVKQVQFSIATDDADKARLIAQAKSFLNEGDKVRLTIRFRNRREERKLDFARQIMKSLLDCFEGFALIDQPLALSGREFACILRKAAN